MKIAWATPVSESSAIARVSADVVASLANRGHSVRVIATEWEASDDLRHALALDTVTWRDAALQGAADDFDVLFANIGDNYAYHAGIFPLLGLWPTVGVFHDYFLHNLFNGWIWEGGRYDAPQQAARHAQVIEDTYGGSSLPMADAARRGEVSLGDIAATVPMTEWVAGACDGALAHAGFYIDRLQAACPGPVRKAAMPVTPRGVPPLGPRGGQRLMVLTVGVMNPNKCVDRVIDAIASSDLAGTAEYHLAGPISSDEAERLSTHAAARNYSGLRIHGAVSDEALQSHLAAADVICCLRNPVLEGSSGSAIEGLLAGRPLIVADAGFYSELPDTVVCKIAPSVPVPDLAQQLLRLARDEPLRRSLGAAARAWATARFDLKAYTDTLEVLAQETLTARPRLAMARGIGRELRMLGLSPADPSIGRISAVVSELFS